MLGLLEALVMEAMTVSPEFFLLCGAPSLPARPRWLTVRRGDAVRLVAV